MATLEKIRNRAVLLIVVIGVAMAAFILGDLFKSRSTFFGQSQREVADINGHAVMIDELQNKIQELTEIYKQSQQTQSLDQQTVDMIHDQVWNNIQREYIMGDEYNELGLAVSEDELFDLVQGDHLSPIVRQLFGNRQTGQVNKSAVLNFLKQKENDPAAKAYWLYWEKEIVSQRLFEKYNTLIAKGLYANSKEAEFVTENSKKSKNIEFFSKPFTSVKDSTLKVSDSEIETYYSAHKDDYKQDASRKIEYVEFDIKASDKDDADVKEWAEKAATEIKSINDQEEIARYVNLNSDSRFVDRYQDKDAVDARLKDFVDESKPGAVYGPYKDNASDAYVVVKLVDEAMRPDSIEAKHILIQEATAERTQELADSIYTVLKNNKSKFTELAEQFSKDQGSAKKGGELGWFQDGMMVPGFNEACVNAKVGEIVEAKSTYGTHIILVQDKSKNVDKVLLATLSRNVEPSTDTYRDVYSEASKFLGENNTYEKFEKAVKEDPSIAKIHHTAATVKSSDKKVNNMDNSRELIRWAFNDAELGKLSDVQELGDRFVIAVVTEIRDKGIQPVEEVEGSIRAELLKDKQAEYLIKEINAAKAESQTLSSLAQKEGAEIKSASNITFGSYYIQGANGYVPSLIGAVVKAPVNEISEPVKGDNAVYVFRVVSEEENKSVPTLDQEKQQLAQGYVYRANYQTFNALKDKAEIDDRRVKFY
ncbi:SurA N-terminal domain-containing protein [Saccharicrinis sp. FJH62]|uniref:peptidylprolyl isomerase n=1 Tax=Saccharicrinis sp. FJH62 TaxID=3344657 RepID=UPI0035D3F8AB